MLPGFSCKIKKFQDNPFLQAIQEPDDASHKDINIMILFVEVKEVIRLRGEEYRKDRCSALNQTQRVEVKMEWPKIKKGLMKRYHYDFICRRERSSTAQGKDRFSILNQTQVG
ncbi:hypothetical protein CDAR_16131 [Caerostris darwini]|uniref:Uncharacterized protein n=1 Tax=Caerostris darwini TaxID=1538125 RepID=A0AAV4UTC1_9ARAC|nr:hypothetical protein CDAR_16131 [Caerostris darwini]